MTLRTILIVLTMFLSVGAAQAGLYKCLDKYGNVTYTNDRASAKGCQTLASDPVSTVSSSQVPKSTPGRTSTPATRTSSPADFPKVNTSTQTSRDGARRTILERELSVEEGQLAEARKELAAGGDAEKLKAIQNKVDLHVRNIEALKKEISRL